MWVGNAYGSHDNLLPIYESDQKLDPRLLLKNLSLAKNISEFEERSMENTIEYLKLRLERIKRTFETEKYQEIMKMEIGESEILQTKDHNYLKDWNVPSDLPLNWDESYNPNYNRVIMNPKKRLAKFGFSS